jgi:hypothetical protein
MRPVAVKAGAAKRQTEEWGTGKRRCEKVERLRGNRGVPVLAPAGVLRGTEMFELRHYSERNSRNRQRTGKLFDAGDIHISQEPSCGTDVWDSFGTQTHHSRTRGVGSYRIIREDEEIQTAEAPASGPLPSMQTIASAITK